MTTSSLSQALQSLHRRLRKVLGPQAAAHDSVIDECAHLCQLYHLSADNLYEKWDLYAVNNGLEDAGLTPDRLSDFRSFVQAEHAKNKASTPSAAPAPAPAMASATPARSLGASAPVASGPYKAVGAGDRTMHNTESLSQLMTQMTQTQLTSSTATPMSGPHSSPLRPPASQSNDPPGHAFIHRTNKGHVELSFNSHLPSSRTAGGFNAVDAMDVDSTPSRKLGKSTPDVVALIDNQDVKPFNYMYDKVNDLGLALDDYLDVFESRFHSALPDVDIFTNPSYASQAPIFAIGRLVAEEIEGQPSNKLAPNNLLLECARKYNGVRVKLLLSNSIDFHSLFPGQVVVVEGINPEGKCLFVDRIHHLPLPDPPTSSASDLLTSARASHSMVVATGPFTLTDTLNFEPLAELVTQIQTHKPELALLIGPFIDDRHPLIRAGDVDQFPDDMFRTQIIQRLVPILTHTQVVLIPSPNDLHHPWCMFPQPPFQSTTAPLPAGIVLLPNPVQFSWHEWVIAVTSTDVIKDMLRCEWSTHAVAPASMSGSDRTLVGARHLLEQRSLYPLDPAPDGAPHVDLARAAQLELQAAPDLLIVPSQLRHAVKPVPLSDAGGVGPDDPVTLMVNPGLAARGRFGGTVAWVSAHGFPPGTLEAVVKEAEKLEVGSEEREQAEAVYHAAHRRIRVDVVRL
ncbi:DNA polymerase alpha/epsilon subunit B-domain-containing protein [Catenaria anguillulae PL171]|uniref:DNA polymerase alpha subunit B n=1 Tax=Catenaria anguillulae PL171 TaxID=765915 RepID=A0A1Y2HKK8_9FUNG|nr:DNA polymerase alpha/epsilon subunit B-domain-containing protein [Catenaria anguillulae PL171]